MKKELTAAGDLDRVSEVRKKKPSSFRRSTEKGDADKVLMQKPADIHDYSLIFIVLFLLAFGLVLLYSTSSYIGIVEHDGDSAYFLKRQLVFTVLGLGLMTGIAFFPYRLWRYFSIPAYFGSIALIMLIPRYGKEVNGAKRWLVYKSFSLQPSEVAKVAIIIFTAFLIEVIGRRRLLKFWGFFLPMIPAGVFAGLLWKVTNNMSSAIIVLAIPFCMLFVACPGYKRFIAIAAAGVAGCVGLIIYIVRIADQNAMGFRGDRILVWLNPQAHSGDTGYQTLQALYAIGSGGIFGKGLGQSMQKLFVPEAQNDMIFSIICEELGLFGALSIMLLFVLLLWRFILVAGNAADLYGALIVTGVVAHIALQVFLNIAVVTNTIPNTGVTLPFISYGGSSLFFLLAEIGMVLSVARANARAAAEREAEAGMPA